MNPAEFGDALHTLGWSDSEFGRRVNVNRVTVSRWRRGRQPIPERIAAWLRDCVRAWHTAPPPPPR